MAYNAQYHGLPNIKMPISLRLAICLVGFSLLVSCGETGPRYSLNVCDYIDDPGHESPCDAGLLQSKFGPAQKN